LNCNIFSQHADLAAEDILKSNKLCLEFEQDELSIVHSQMDRYPRAADYLHILETRAITNYPFSCKKMRYTATFHNIQYIDPQKPGLLLPIKDSIDLLEFTLSNLKKMKVTEVANITIIDDRSEEAEKIQQLANQHGAIYIRVDYPSEIFNFSMLNNIAAFLYHKLGHEDIILWNADLWAPDKTTVPKLLNAHKKSKRDGVKLTGTKLLYPESGFCPLINEQRTVRELAQDFTMPEENLKNMGLFGKTQYGGGSYVVTIPFLKNLSHLFMSPVHYGRFLERTNSAVNINRQTRFVTGAFQIIDLESFIKLGGLCPTLSCSHQDADFCLRLVHGGDKVQYIGKDLHLYHGESLVISSKLEEGAESLKHAHSDTRDKLISDEVMYSLLWNYYFFTGQIAS